MAMQSAVRKVVQMDVMRVVCSGEQRVEKRESKRVGCWAARRVSQKVVQ